MSDNFIGSKANGNDEVQRAEKARKGLFSAVKSLQVPPNTEFSEAYLNRNTFLCRRSRTFMSESLMGKGSPWMSVAVTNRSSSSTYGESLGFSFVSGVSISSKARNNFRYMRRL